MIRKMEYVGLDANLIKIEIYANDYYKMHESVINKSLMIAMNYIMENMETKEQESAE